MIVEVNSGSQNLLQSRGVKPGEYFILFGGDPSYEFVISLTAASGDDKLQIVFNDDGSYSIEMDEALVKKIKLYDDDDEARVDLFDNEDFAFLKDGELSATLF